jgi:signal transduction histidine kinase/CheY-like chemotaxis protein
MLTESRELTERVIDQVTEQTRDHQPVLADFAARLEPLANELIDEWSRQYRALVSGQLLPPQVLERNAPNEAVRAFFTELKQNNLSAAYGAFASWEMQTAIDGLGYDLVLQIIRTGQQATLALVTRAYVNDIQLPLVLDALEEAFDGIVTLAGAAFQSALQRRLAGTMQWQTLGQLSGGAAHVLNNLLAAIIGRAQILIEQTPEDAIRNELQEIRSVATTGARVVQRLQAFTQPDGIRQPPHADANLLLRDAAEVTRFLWRDQAESVGVVIDVVQDFADVPPIQGRPAIMRQVLVALLLNAIEAMPQGGLIMLRTERKDDRVLISIVDNGVGMSEVVKEHIYDPFFTTKELPHLGLGLSAASKIVSELKGALQIVSKSGHGTTVVLSLPIAKGFGEGGTRPMALNRSATILVIDNEPSVRELLSRLLKLYGHDVVTAESGAEGISAFKQGKFDLVFTDLGMPEMSGWDVASEIRKLNSRAFVALTTGWPIDLSYKELKDRGVDKVVPKPFEISVLLGLINDAMVLHSKK